MGGFNVTDEEYDLVVDKFHSTKDNTAKHLEHITGIKKQKINYILTKYLNTKRVKKNQDQEYKL